MLTPELSTGLRTYSCTRLDELNDLDMVRVWGDQFDIWEMAYQKSRATDSLRMTLVKQMCGEVFHDAKGKELRGDTHFHSFLERTPELAVKMYEEAYDRI